MSDTLETEPVAPENVETPSPEVETPSTSLLSVDAWAADVAIKFLDLMDIANVNERRKALLALEMGKKEENIVTLLKIADSYLFLAQKHYETTDSDAESGIAAVKIYVAKSIAMKSWLGI